MAAPPSTLPSTLALAIGFTFVGAITGFFLGQASSIGVFGGSSGSIQPQRRRVAKHSGTVGSKNRHDADESDEEESGSEDEQEGLQGFEKHGGECKLTLVVRSDLGMGKGMSDFLWWLFIYRAEQNATCGNESMYGNPSFTPGLKEPRIDALSP